jgi:hypothetical protein
MKRVALFLGIAFGLTAGANLIKAGPGETNAARTVLSLADTMQKYGIDPKSSLESRVKETPAKILEMFEHTGGNRPKKSARPPR